MDVFQFPWDTGTSTPVMARPLPEAPPTKPNRKGRRPVAATRPVGAETTAAVAWLYHHLTIAGPAAAVAAFAAAARGAGVTPWQLDFAALEEDVFIRAVAQPANRRTLTVEGCRILARQFREQVEMRQARAAALVGHSLACPFDLHALLPVPQAILQLGPTHPAAQAWLTTHWGVTDRLRQVVPRAKPSIGRPSTRKRGRPPKGYAVIGYGFFTDGETPYAALAALAARYPNLRFVLQPRPAD